MDELVAEGVFETTVNLKAVIEEAVDGRTFRLPKGGGTLTFSPVTRVTVDRKRQLILFDPKPVVETSAGFLFFKTRISTTVSGVRVGLDECVLLIDGYPDHAVRLLWS